MEHPRAYFVGADFGPGDINTKDYTEELFDVFTSMGYWTVASLAPKYSNISNLSRYEDSIVLMFAGHGTNDYVRFNHLNSNGDYACAITYSNQTPVVVNGVTYLKLLPCNQSTWMLLSWLYL